MTRARRTTRENAIWISPGATAFSCLCERCLDAAANGSFFLDAIRSSAVRGELALETHVAVVRCSSGHELVVRRGERPANLARKDARQLQLA